MSFEVKAREARRAAAMAVLSDPEATPRDVAAARAALASKPTDLRKLTDDQLALWIYLREILAGREPESDVNARTEQAAHCQALADDLAATAEATPTAGTRPAVPGCRRCRDFTDEDIGDLRAVTPLMLPPGDPDHEHE